MSNLINLIGIHGTTVFATPEKAERLMRIQGYRKVEESAPEVVSEAPTVPVEVKKATRGRPRKA